MTTKRRDLEERTFSYAQNVLTFVRLCPRTVTNSELVRQLVRSAGSVGANYIEAKESLGPKDLAMRIRICRKEVKESRYWLRLLEIKGDATEDKRRTLVQESTELLKIFTAIVAKLKQPTES
jgi:four helix bundle protein